MKKSISLLLLILSIDLYGQELPCKSYYKQSEGGRCKERYKEDANGEKHGLYIKYSENGDVMARGNIVHGSMEGNWYGFGEYQFLVKNECITYQTYGLYFKTMQDNVWFPTCVTSPTPIKSLEEAKAIGVKLHTAEKQRVDGKLKKEIAKEKEKEQEETIKYEFNLCKTPWEYEAFITKYPNSKYVGEARAAIEANNSKSTELNLQNDFMFLVALKNSYDEDDLKSLVTKGEAYLKDDNNGVFLSQDGRKQKLLDAIQIAKNRLKQ